MQLHFEPVCIKNRKEIEELQVFPEQSGFIESVVECLAEADELEQWKPVGIYDQNVPVGFAMYGYFRNPLPDGRLWLDRLLIDRKYQHKGYGKAAILALLEKLRGEYNTGKVYLSVYDTNPVAIELYRQIGFCFNGEYDTKGEKVMVYHFPVNTP